MFPPVDEAVLGNNPQFATLHNTLTTAVLNPDCSTKNDPARKERDAVKQALRSHRLKTTKHQLLITAISTASPTPEAPKPTLRRPRGVPQPPPPSTTSLPQPLLDLLLLLPPLLSAPSHSLSAESTTLILSHPPFTALPTLLPLLAPTVSSFLVSAAATLARMLNPSTNSSFIHRSIPALPTSTASLISALSSQKTFLSRSRHETATSLTRLLSLRAAALEQLIRALESKHGNLSRNLELRAAEIALSAASRERAAAALLDGAQREVYAPRAAAALGRYAAHLGDAKARLREEIEGLAEELGRYGVVVSDDAGQSGSGSGSGSGDGGGGGCGDEARERTMREMARVYRDMARQIEEARRDLERLGRA